jgi:hypothetical protein
MHGEMRNAYKILLGKPEWKRPIEGPGHTWEDNIKIDLKEMRCVGVNWIRLAQDTVRWWSLVNTTINLRFP